MNIKKTRGGIYKQGGKFAVRMTFNYKTLSLGSYDTRKEANEILTKARKAVKNYHHYFDEMLKMVMSDLNSLNKTQKANPKCYYKVGNYYRVVINKKYIGNAKTIEQAKELINQHRQKQVDRITAKYDRRRAKILS